MADFVPRGNPALSTRLRLWLIRRLMPHGYQLSQRLVMGLPPEALQRVEDGVRARAEIYGSNPKEALRDTE